MRQLRFLLCLCSAALFFELPRPREANAESPPATRVDSDGDALPFRAVARLGTTRFRHDNGPWDVVYSPNGKFIASWIDDPETIYIWDAETGKGLYRFLQPEHAVYPRIAFSADGKYFGGYHSVWDLKTGKEFLGLGGDFRAFSEDGPRVASLDEGKIQIWDLPNRKKLRDFPGQFLAFSKDGKRLTTQVEDMVVVWNAETGGKLRQLAGKFLNHSAGQIVACSDGEDLRLWDTSTGKQQARIPPVFAFEDRPPFPRQSFSGDGKLFAGFEMKGDFDEKASIWDTSNGKKICDLIAPRRITFVGIQIAPNGKTVTTLNFGANYVWDAATGKLIHGKIQGNRVAYSPDSKRIASTNGHTIRIWDAATGEERIPFSGPADAVRCVSFSADGNTVVAGYGVDAGTFRSWDVASSKELRTFKRDFLGKHKGAVFSPDGKSLLFVQVGKLEILHLATGKEISLDSERTNTLQSLSFSPDGKNITALEMRQLNKNDSSLDRPKCEAVFRFLDGPNGRDLPEKDRPRWAASLQRLAPEHGPSSVAFSISADFRLLAWVRLDNWDSGQAKDLRLREIATGKELPAVGFGGEVRALALSPDSRLLAAVTVDRRLRFWDIAAGKEIASWPNSHSMMKSVAFRPDGKTVAVGCADSTILIYDVPSLPESTPVAADDLDRLWADLASADTAVAYRAIARLRADPKSTAELFKTRLSPIPKEASANAAAMVADLDSSSFAKREAASAAIAKLGQDAIAALRWALANNPGAEHRERLEKALANLNQQVAATEDVRRLRALQVLELIGSAESIELLKKMSDGPDEAWITQEAKESVFRLTKRR